METTRTADLMTPGERVQPSQATSKACPYCAEQIQSAAIKCRFCGEFLDRPRRAKGKWWHSNAVVVLAVLSLGPLALPLVWKNPRYSLTVKAAVSVAVIVLSVLLYYATVEMYRNFLEQFKSLGL